MTAPNLSSFMATVAAKRADRVAELESSLDNGRKVLQLGSVWPECSPFRADVGNAYLAAHIESREHGFGCAAEILTPLQLWHRGYVRSADGWRMGPPRLEVEVERDRDPSPFYGLRGDS